MLRLFLLLTALPLLLPAAVCPCRLARAMAQALPPGPADEAVPPAGEEHDDPLHHHDDDCPGEKVQGGGGPGKPAVTPPALTAALASPARPTLIAGPALLPGETPAFPSSEPPLYLKVRALRI